LLTNMRDLKNPSWITAKAFLFLILGLSSAALLLSEHPTMKVAVLLTLAIWSFCRLYYFAFYVIEHYVDPSYRFSGLLSVAEHWLRKGKGKDNDLSPSPATAPLLSRPHETDSAEPAPPSEAR
jgi:hypothetical protein